MSNRHHQVPNDISSFSKSEIYPLTEVVCVKNTLDTGTLETLKLRVQVPGRVEVGEEKTPLPAPRHRV